MPSYFSSEVNNSTLSWYVSIFLISNSATTLFIKAIFLPTLSIRLTLISGFTMAIIIPGNPAPVPTSSSEEDFIKGIIDKQSKK